MEATDSQEHQKMFFETHTNTHLSFRGNPSGSLHKNIFHCKRSMLASCSTKSESAENSLSLPTLGMLLLSLYNSQPKLAGNYQGLCNNNEIEN